MNDKYEKEQIMQNTIYKTLEEYPELLNSALNAIFSGMNGAIDNLRTKMSSLDLAFISALGIIESKSKDKKLRDFQTELVLNHLKQYGGTAPIEKETIKNLTKSQKENE